MYNVEKRVNCCSALLDCQDFLYYALVKVAIFFFFWFVFVQMIWMPLSSRLFAGVSLSFSAVAMDEVHSMLETYSQCFYCSPIKTRNDHTQPMGAC